MSGKARGLHINMLMLKELFTRTALSFNPDNNLVTRLWNEISTHYDHPKRHYHTRAHLQQLLGQLTIYKENVCDWDIMIFAVFYHDIIYNVLKTNNEERSAALAKKRLAELKVPLHRAGECANHILATKTHSAKPNADAALLVDGDLSILGSGWNTYWHYVGLVRKEYQIVPDVIFRPGRKKVVRHFLERDQIYLTPGFFRKYEMRARQNLERELTYWESLS